MDKFTASNGNTIEGTPTRIIVRDRTGFMKYDLGKYTVEALREYFQAENDSDLGWWRDPETPGYIVRADPVIPRQVAVLHERSWQLFRVSERELSERVLPSERQMAAQRAARTYFEAHPERKPWEDAKDGEIWVVNETSVAIVRRCADGVEAYFESVNQGNPWGHAARHAKSARRIWPEGD